MDASRTPGAYRVFARKYRPTRFSELIGQEALVRTLTNALTSGRIAHAFLLSGIRGVGKTTTARLLARALNCTGPDGTGGPTPEPCGACPSCRAIAEERPLDVIEMDAATRTGIDDIRELVDSVRYAPAASRYKVYIIDEVHMLSAQAFNGLLKTLEEPPPHCKFVFATTEVRKVPVTVLSRCQRFDLRRVQAPVLEGHLAWICERESVTIEPAALRLIAVAAEGSVRDSQSLLDQAVSLADGPVTALQVQDMLGLGDRRRVVELCEAVLDGAAARALERFGELYALGAEPVAVLQDLLGLAHGLSRLQSGVPVGATGLAFGPELEARLVALAERWPLPVLARAWQMLLKGIDEVRMAPDAVAAVEMVLLRLACVSDVPPPAELARLLRQGGVDSSPAAAPSAVASAPGPVAPMPTPSPGPAREAARAQPALAREPAPAERALARVAPEIASAASAPCPENFAALIGLLRSRGESPLAAWLERGAHPIRFEPGVVEFRPEPSLPGDAAGRLREALVRMTGRPWTVVLGQAAGEPTLAELQAERSRARIAALGRDASLRRVLDAFPGAEILEVRATAPASRDGPPEPSHEPTRNSEVERA